MYDECIKKFRNDLTVRETSSRAENLVPVEREIKENIIIFLLKFFYRWNGKRFIRRKIE